MVLLVGGLIPGSVLPTSGAELIDLDDAGATCSAVADFPSSAGIAYGSGVQYTVRIISLHTYIPLLTFYLPYQNNPTVCGGVSNKQSSVDCFSYVPSSNSWTASVAKMLLARQQVYVTDILNLNVE